MSATHAIKSITNEQKQKTVNGNNNLKILTHAIRNTLSDNKFRNCIKSNDKIRMQNIIKKTIDWMDTNVNANIEQFEAKKQQLEQVWNPIITQAFAVNISNISEESEQRDMDDERSKYIQQLMDQISSLRLELAKQERNNKLQNKQIAELKNKLGLKDKQFNKLQDNYNALQIKFKKEKQNIGYKSWQYNDVFEWIINIENQRFKKYEKKLLNKLKEECIDGTCLGEMNENDLHRLGITQFKDKKRLMKHIEKLIAQNVESNVNNDEGASTAYI